MNITSVQVIVPLGKDCVILSLKIELDGEEIVETEQEFTKAEWEQIAKGRGYWQKAVGG